MKTAYCLDCDHTIQLGDRLQVGYAVECPNCESEFELTHLNPPTLEWYYDDEWDDDEWDDDEYADDESDWGEEEEEEEEAWSWMIAKQKRANSVRSQIPNRVREPSRHSATVGQTQARNRARAQHPKYENSDYR